ncbi:DnaJ-domain-containing protein [Thelephora ganbajun]|uniref:DnaJ-domain-containing protein n=1 Tax=Thelephora ganbajun TaxID=370292 RepID=A0ACB6ZUF5_THEGA|nr:DnaJ-domain-containing protein [Thelephora ganbajun]
MRPSCPRFATHYETLAVPQNATKAQIKLSKKYHPDVNSDSASQGKFRAISEAYTILGHDRERRAYDRTLLEAPIPKPSYNYGAFYETRRQRGPKATYAWEPRRGSPSYSNPHSSSSSSQHPHSRTQSHPHPYHYHQPEPSPFFHPGQKPPRGSGQRDPMAEHDRAVAVSSFWRAVQVSGLIVIVITIGGALGSPIS